MKVEFKHKKILEKLYSANEAEVLKTLLSLRDTGDATIIYHLIQLLHNTKSPNIQNEVKRLLLDVKDEKAAQPLAEAVKNKEFEEEREFLTSVCWQAPLDFSEYLEVFIDLVLFAPYQTSVEAFTVIEEAGYKLTENQRERYMNYTKLNLPEVEEIKKPLAFELIEVFKGM